MTDSDQSLAPIFSDDAQGMSAEYWAQQYRIAQWAISESYRLHNAAISDAVQAEQQRGDQRVKDEREACAKVAEELTWFNSAGIAAAIRARGNGGK